MTNSENTVRELGVEPRPLRALRPNPRNARTHSKRQIKAIAGSIEAFGFVNPVVIDDTGVILAGHGRFEAAKLLGLEKVPTIKVSMTRNAIMYSLTRLLIASQLASTQIGVKKVESNTKNSEMPSIPMW